MLDDAVTVNIVHLKQRCYCICRSTILVTLDRSNDEGVYNNVMVAINILLSMNSKSGSWMLYQDCTYSRNANPTAGAAVLVIILPESEL
jgi:hypothetical protein